MRARYQRWMHEWETRLTSRDTNRVVRPFDWGIEWTNGWPGLNGAAPHPDRGPLESQFHRLNQYLVGNSDHFFSYQTPADFRLETRKVEPCFPGDGARPAKDYGSAEFLRFTSAVASPHAENNTANARWFPASGRRA